MAVRGAQAIIATYSRVGLLCVAGSARTCIAHGLPEAPDAIGFVPVIGGSNTASLHPQCLHLESWDATSVVFVHSIGLTTNLYVDMHVIHSIGE